MKLTKILTAGAAGMAILASAPLSAQSQTGKSDIWQRLAAMDKDKDEVVTKAEFTGPERIFERLDSNKDGKVTKAEAKAMRRGGGGSDRRGSGREDNAPKVGDQAPEVSAKKLKGGEVVDLSSPEKITVLVFGSHT